MDPGEKYNQPYPPAPHDPFSDRAPTPHAPYDATYSSQPGAAYASNASLPGAFGAGQSYLPQDDEEEEKLPLTRGEAMYPGGYYPPSG